MDGVEVVVRVVKTSGRGGGASRMAELNVWVFSSCKENVAFLTKAVSEDDVATLFCKVNSGFISSIGFWGIPFEKELIVGQAECFFHAHGTCVVIGGVPFVFVTNVDKTNFDLISGHAFCDSRNSEHAHHETQGYQQANKLFHSMHPPKLLDVLLLQRSYHTTIFVICKYKTRTILKKSSFLFDSQC